MRNCIEGVVSEVLENTSVPSLAMAALLRLAWAVGPKTQVSGLGLELLDRSLQFCLLLRIHYGRAQTDKQR